MAALDYYEFVPIDYQRTPIDLQIRTDEIITAYAYVQHKIGSPGLASKEYMSTIIKGAIETNLPKEYITKYLQV